MKLLDADVMGGLNIAVPENLSLFNNNFSGIRKTHSDSSSARSKNQDTFHLFLISCAYQEFPLPTLDRRYTLQYPLGAVQRFRNELLDPSNSPDHFIWLRRRST